ncbi:putative isomerase YbhE [Cristinia sonorae]|uniref:Isomerase YbhE n=1 Tax=Cristinia sonorae TaxID=1940300 RepID=A0A8K0USV4_9AGAR|nr:putative isomerase YbhE [Cristinia sonorae]
MVNFTILAGGYTSFIASYLFNSDTSSLTLLNQSPTGQNPSWITQHPTNKSILYAVNENSPGALQSFTIGAQGALHGPIGQANSDGDSPAFTAPLSTGQVAIMNYNTGNGLIIPTTTDPLHFGSATPITFPFSGSHPHMAVQHGSEVFVPDLGADRIWRLVENGSPSNWRIQGFIAQPKGSGPRHIAIRNNTLFTLHELSSTLTQQQIPPAPNGTSTIDATFSILPPNPPAQAEWHAGEILLTEASPQFNQPFIYVSNRNTGPILDPRGDAIAIFAVEPQLRFIKHVFTGLDQIRGMMVGGPENEFLIASGVAGNAGVIMLKRTNGGADLEIIATNQQLPTRTSFVWLD